MSKYHLVESPFLWHARDTSLSSRSDGRLRVVIEVKVTRRVYVDDPEVREKEANSIGAGSFTAVLGPDNKTVEIGPKFSATAMLYAPGFSCIARADFKIKPPYSVEAFVLLANSVDNENPIVVDGVDNPDSAISQLLSASPSASAAIKKLMKIASLSTHKLDAKERRLTLVHKPDVDTATAFETIVDVATKVGGSLASSRAAAHYEALGSTTAHITARARGGEFARDIDVHLVFETEEQYGAFIRGITRCGLSVNFD